MAALSMLSARASPSGNCFRRASIITVRKSPLMRPCQRSSTTSASDLAQVNLAALPGPTLRRHRDLRKAKERQHACFGKAFDRRRDLGHGFIGDQARIAAEQGERDDRHGRSRRLGRHVAKLRRRDQRSIALRAAFGEHRPLRFDSGRREGCGDDPTLLAPQFRRQTSAGPRPMIGSSNVLTISGLA